GVEFGHGPVDVGLGGRRADDQPVGDLVVGQAVGGQDDRLAFAAGQLGEPAAAAVACEGARWLGDVPVDESAGEGGCEQRVPAGGDADGVQEVLRKDVLDQETGRSGAQRVEDVLVHAVVGQHDDVDGGQGRVRGDAPGRFDAVHDGHLDVDESDIG